MFELADRLVGIYKTHDATKSVTINPRLFVAAATDRAKQAKETSAHTNNEVERTPARVLSDVTNIL